MDGQAYAQALEPFEAETERLRPPNAEVFDAHTHLGLDEDGRALELGALLALLDAAGAQRACVFPLHDPERVPAYRAPNDRVLRWAQESEGRLVPFCRLDPADGPLAEGERALAAGARGIKLHPRAHTFAFVGEHIAEIFALADQAAVPILIHAGRGMPPIADGLADLAWRYPDVVLILAHAGIADQGILTTRLADHPGVLYDVSCFYPLDVLELFARVPAERIVFASDPPYGRPATALYMALRIAAAVGLDEAAVRLFMGETMGGLCDRHGLAAARAPRGSRTVTMSGPLARVYSYCTTSGPALFSGQPEIVRGALELAIAACRDPEPPDRLGPALEQIASALSTAIASLDEPIDVLSTLDLVHRCMSLAATEPA